MAELFVVSKQEKPDEPVEESEDFELTGDTALDLETALRAIAFLYDWVISIGPEGIAECADSVRAFRQERRR
jgi:hypothetical protein